MKDRGLTQNDWYTVYGSPMGPKRFDTIAEAMAYFDKFDGKIQDQMYVAHIEVVHRNGNR